MIGRMDHVIHGATALPCIVDRLGVGESIAKLGLEPLNKQVSTFNALQP